MRSTNSRCSISTPIVSRARRRGPRAPCLPGRMAEKLMAVDHLRPLMSERAVLFGATILWRGIEPNAVARSLLGLYNAKGVFNNRDDDLAELSDGLEQRFDQVDIETEGCVALFHARR